MKKYLITVEEHDYFEYHSAKTTVIATLDKDNNTLWYTDSYGLDGIAYLNEHPEAIEVA